MDMRRMWSKQGGYKRFFKYNFMKAERECRLLITLSVLLLCVWFRTVWSLFLCCVKQCTVAVCIRDSLSIADPVELLLYI